MIQGQTDESRGGAGALEERWAVTAAFDFATAGRIMAGTGRAAELPNVLSGLGSRALVCIGSNPSRHGQLLAAIDMPTEIFAVAGEPTIATARAAAAVARDHGADVVTAIGGGSVIDVGKCVAMLLANGGDPLDYMEVIGAGRKITQHAAPFVAVPTTAGTGTEVTANAVLAAPAHGVKASLRSPMMIPRIALVDPELTVSCPPPVTASSGLDALTQCLEPFVSRQANALTDGLSVEGLRRGASGLRIAYADGDDIDARTDMAMCSLLGGIALANARLGAVHGLAGVIGGTAHVPHGLACAALLAPVIEANIRVLTASQPGHPALGRYAQVAALLAGRTGASIEEGVAWIRDTVVLLEIPGLAAFGITSQQADEIAARAIKSSSMQGNPVALSLSDLREVILQAL
jgi:alcohol dehydrogenase class IV